MKSFLWKISQKTSLLLIFFVKAKKIQTEMKMLKSETEAKQSTVKIKTILENLIEFDLRRNFLRKLCDRNLNFSAELKSHEFSIPRMEMDGNCLISMFSGPQSVCSLNFFILIQ